MDSPIRTLKEGESGPYSELLARPCPKGLRFLFMPALAALLEHAEVLNGAPLTEDQVFAVRDGAQVVVAPADVVRAVEADRGYAEVDHARPWESWQALRAAGE